MSFALISSMFGVGVDILRTTVSSATQSILALVGDNSTQSTEGDGVEWWQQVGFISRPSLPAAGTAACQGVIMKRGDRDVCIASRDLRGQALSGNIKDGETCLYAPGSDGNGQARVLLKADGSVNIFTRMGNTSGGQGVIFRVGADGGIALQSPYGAITIDSKGITLTSGAAALTLGPTGVAKLTGAAVGINGLLTASISGTTATLIGPAPVPFSPTNAVVYGPSGVTAIPSTNVFIGP